MVISFLGKMSKIKLKHFERGARILRGRTKEIFEHHGVDNIN